MEIRIELPGVRLGLIEAEQVVIAPSDAELALEICRVCERLRKALSVEEVTTLDSVRSVRAMFRAWGVDPARYRPSAEALLRRVVQGKALYGVSNVVDAANLGSIEAGWPFGSYDRAMISGAVSFRLGNSGERYVGIGRKVWHLEGRPVLADVSGPFGSPISDSTRAMIRPTTTALLAVIFAPAKASEATLKSIVARHAQRIERFAKTRVTYTAISG